jgi:hypothetical protein
VLREKKGAIHGEKMRRTLMKKKVALLIGTVFLIFDLAASEAKASISYDLTYLINGYQHQGGYWLTAAFADVGTNTVTLKLTSNLSTDPSSCLYPYYFDQVVFNVDPAITPSSLVILQTDSTGTIGDVNILKDEQNAIAMTGSGKAGKGFDVLLDFPSKHAQRFNFTDTITFTIIGDRITEDSFLFMNAPGNSAHVGAHLAGIPDGMSGAISDVPIPSTVWLLGFGLLSLIVLRRKFFG